MTTRLAAIAELERLAGQDIRGRNIGRLAAAVRGNLERAAASIARHPRPSIAIITGFYLVDGDPPNCETDGPPGAVMLAAGLAAVGVPCRLATDAINAGVVRATLAGLGDVQAIPVDIVANAEHPSLGGEPVEAIAEAWRTCDPAITHVIAIERCGPSRDGRPRDSKGRDIGHVNAPMEVLFGAGTWETIGIGDLGNEIGMGSLPADVVSGFVANGAAIHCSVACDHALVGEISNLAGAAMLGALALSRADWLEAMAEQLSPASALRLLDAAVSNGKAVALHPTGGRPYPYLAVDTIPWETLETVYRDMYELCRTHFAGGKS